MIQGGLTTFAIAALAMLLADGNGRGGGDLRIDDDSPAADVVGAWAGDRIVVAGDYADPGRWFTGTPEELQKGYANPETVNLHAYAAKHYQDISGQVIQAMLADPYLRHVLQSQNAFGAQVPLNATDKTPLTYNETSRRWQLTEGKSKYEALEKPTSKALRADLVITAAQK